MAKFKHDDNRGSCFSRFRIYDTGPMMEEGKFKLSKELSALACLQECFITAFPSPELRAYLLDCQEQIGPMPKGSRMGFRFEPKAYEKTDETKARATVRALGNKATLNDEEEALLSWAKIVVGPKWLEENLHKEDAYQSAERVDRNVA